MASILFRGDELIGHDQKWQKMAGKKVTDGQTTTELNYLGGYHLHHDACNHWSRQDKSWMVTQWGIRADFKFVPSEWETALLCNDISRWLGSNLESALGYHYFPVTFHITLFTSNGGGLCIAKSLPELILIYTQGNIFQWNCIRN